MPAEITYSIRFRGQRHVVHMKLKKTMIPENLPVYTTNDQGAEQEDYPFVPRDCYFYSYLEGVPGSQATLDTCNGGLNGMLQVDDFTYEIKPLASSSKFEHVISLLVVEERSLESKRCRNEEQVAEADESLEETKLVGSPRAAPVYLWRVHVKVLRVHYTMSCVVTNAFKNLTRAVEMILIMNSISNTIYKLSGIDVVAGALTMWESYDPVNIGLYARDVNGLLNTFGNRQEKVNQHVKISTAVILSGIRLENIDYMGRINTLCKHREAISYVNAASRHAFMVAIFMSHSTGHVMGLEHDTPGCYCFRRNNCLMHDYPVLTDMLSNCSQAAVHKRIHEWDECLSENRVLYESYKYEVPRCGNKKVDKTEECDCGSLKECAYNRCCTTTCIFTQGSTCNLGGCCIDCSFAPFGTVCRDKLGICDLPEYCDGTSQKCPENFYIQDGTPCSPLAVCMSGNCSDRNLQCQALFGYGVRDAAPICYKLNAIGDRFGNCGVTKQRGGSKPLACEDDGIYCGLLHCDGVSRVPGGGEHTTFHHIKVQGVKEEQCFGYDAHHGTEVPEMGLVVDGANCGAGKFCRGKACIFHQNFNFNCNISHCNFRGVCNNRGNCHCMHGWQPPTCEERGAGGSVDSGPTVFSKKSFRAKIHVSVNRILLVLFTRMALILVSLLFGGISKAIIAIDTRKGHHPEKGN